MQSQVPEAPNGTRPKQGQILLLECVGKRVILDDMLRKRAWVRFPSTTLYHVRMVELADTPDSKSGAVTGVRVRIPLLALTK